jgi:hypothetical protein
LLNKFLLGSFLFGIFLEDEDLKAPRPFFFHHKGQDLDSAGQNKAADQVCT